MKKILAILLVMAMLCSFAACGGTETTGANGETTAPETTAPDTTNPETTAPVEDETTAPVEDNTTAPDPTEPSADPTEPSVDPTEPSVDPTEPSVDPTEPTEPEDPDTFPAADTAYYYGMVQGMKDNAVYYLAGGMNGYYMETTTDASAALKVYLEETDGGYYLYCFVGEVKTYINMTVNGTHVNAEYQTTASTVYTYDEGKNILVATVNGTEYTHGTASGETYTTVGPVAVSANGYWCTLYTEDTLPAEPEKPELPEFDTTLTVEELLNLPVADGETTSGRYYVIATIKSVTNAKYGAMIITDSTGKTISVYGAYSADGTVGYASLEDQPVKGDEVKLYVNVKNFGGVLEINNARIIEVTHNYIDESAYTEMTITEARQQEVGTLIKVEGVVAAITYANGYIPDGVVLVDETGSILIYDRDLAGRVSVGNKISLAGTKAMWINDSEISNAAKWNYAGCNQIDNAYLLTNDEGENDFDKTWIAETTIKAIVDTPITSDITTVIYKVNAYVTEKAGTGYTNFYLFDLDGETGSYSYTKCNGGDFAWLREYEGKICTVYMMAINAKSESAGCIWRFLPIAVEEVDVDTSYVNIPEFVIDYFAAEQFDTKYVANPDKELLTSISSALLNIEGATLTYQSSDETIISVADGKLVCVTDGKVTITITCEYDGKTASKTVEVTYEKAKEPESISVSEAIAAELGTEVSVKGIVGPSLVNQKGFYLMSDEGMIAVLTDTDTLAALQIGNVVVVKGIRSLKNKYIDQGLTANQFGQTYINNATVIWNAYGQESWDTSWYTEGMTAGQLNDLDVMIDYTTNVYIITGTLSMQGYNVSITDSDGKYLGMYIGSSDQYSWLQDYVGQEIKVSVAVCNWNAKNFWKGCIMSLYTADGTEIYNELNFNVE